MENIKASAAIRYAEKGQYVLPMDGKRPLIKFADQPPLTVEQIKDYWNKWPNANIALRTVSFFVVDIDTKNGHASNGFKTAEEWTKQGILTPTLQQGTASGGLQLFYKKPADKKLKQVIGIRPGIDIKAHPNNYVVVPPSKTNKGKYEWIDKGNTKQEPIKQIQEPSRKLIELIENHHTPTNSVKPLFRYKTSGKLWTGQVLDNIVAGASQGQRNDFLTRLCGQMLHAKAKPQTVYELLNVANQYCTPPLSENEINKIFNSILKKEINRYERKH